MVKINAEKLKAVKLINTKNKIRFHEPNNLVSVRITNLSTFKF
jgi:ribosomal 50S subunit-recycling heat shock protein